MEPDPGPQPALISVRGHILRPVFTQNPTQLREADKNDFLETYVRLQDIVGALARVHARAGEVANREGRDPEPDFARAEQLLKQARAIEPDHAEHLTVEGNHGYGAFAASHSAGQGSPS